MVAAGGTLSYTEKATAATASTRGLTVTDVDSANLAGATVSDHRRTSSPADVLGFTNQNGITGSFNAATGALTLTGSASVANYQTALRLGHLRPTTSDNPSTSARTVTIIAQ